MTTFNLLWTGGLDSTFRLCELSRIENITIQPYYILDTNRSSIKKEQLAMSKILKLLRSKSSTKAEIMDVKIIKKEMIAQDELITKAWTQLNKKYLLGVQYDFLARFAKQNNLNLEIGLESSIRSKAANTLMAESKLEEKNYDDIRWLEIVPERSTDEAVSVFEHLHIPIPLFYIEKLDEWKQLEEWDLADIAKSTWFCHKPVFGMPCGQCNPCRDALNEGMSWRVPVLGRTLGKIRNIPIILLKAIKK